MSILFDVRRAELKFGAYVVRRPARAFLAISESSESIRRREHGRRHRKRRLGLR